MPRDLKRRTFLGLGLAAAGGAVVAVRGTVGEARWAAKRSLAEAQLELSADLPDAPDGAEAAVRLVITTPRGVQVSDVGTLVVRAGRAEGPVRLAYPFAERVVGDYDVHAEVRAGRHMAKTQAPVRYFVRRLVWFCVTLAGRGLLGLALAAALLPASVHGAVPGFPQAKINHIDATGAPRIKVYVSLLDARLRQVPEKWPETITVFQKPEGEKAVELFSMTDGEPTFPTPDGAEAPPEVPKEELPAVHIAGDDERGMAAVVVIPGFNDISYSEGTLGERIKGGAGLFFKKLGKTNRMNAVWYNDFVSTWVEAKGRTMQLTPLTKDIREQCRAWDLQQAERHGEPPPEEPPEGLEPDEAHCGLTAKYEELGKIVEAETFKGFYPNLFGLSTPLCTDKPQQPRMSTGALLREGETEDFGPPAIEVALRMLVEGAQPGQPRALILLGDGRDGYIYRDRECRDHLRAMCAETNTSYDNIKKCIDDAMDKATIKEQQLFGERLPAWLALAKSGNVRIFSVTDPEATPSARERMEILAWRTGGTARVAEDANQVVDLYSDLTAELSGQHVISFTDHEAVPGATRAYEVRLKGRGGSFTTDSFSVTLPRPAESLALQVADARAMVEAKLGKKVVLAIAIGLALVVLLILLKLVLKLVGKKGGGALKKAGGLAKKGSAAAKKAAAAQAKAKS